MPIPTYALELIYKAGFEPAMNWATGFAVFSVWVTDRAGPVPALLMEMFDVSSKVFWIVTFWRTLLPATVKEPAMNTLDEYEMWDEVVVH